MDVDSPLTRRTLLAGGLGSALALPAIARGRLPRRPASTPPLVVLDPGHGGKDPGAIGVTGLYEKQVSIAAAGAVAAHLQAGGRYRVSLTRSTDMFIPLDERVAIAEAAGASLFLSLHADAIHNPAIRGASVYTLGAASDAQTAALAARENSADRYGGIPAAAPEVAAILASLVRHETRLGSARLQKHVVASLAASLPMLDNPARHAGFAVLKAPAIPSVLIEMGFMSNPRDEAELRRPGLHATVAVAVRRAVDEYFARAPHLTQA